MDVLRTELPYFGPTRDALQRSAVEHQLSERWCEVDYKYDRFPIVSLFGFAISNIAHRFTTLIYSKLLSRTMNNFADLDMLNIGFIQFVLEEQDCNDLVGQQRRRGHDDWRYPWCTWCFQVFDVLMCTAWSGEQEWELGTTDWIFI